MTGEPNDATTSTGPTEAIASTGPTEAVTSTEPTRTVAVQDYPADRTDRTDRPDRRPVRMRTVVLGVVLLAVSVVAILNLATSLRPDPGAVVLALLIGCGILLIAGARRE